MLNQEKCKITMATKVLNIKFYHGFNKKSIQHPPHNQISTSIVYILIFHHNTMGSRNVITLSTGNQTLTLMTLLEQVVTTIKPLCPKNLEVPLTQNIQ